MNRFCSNCGQELEEGSAFCAECGAPVEEEPGGQPAQPAYQPQLSPEQPVPGNSKFQPAKKKKGKVPVIILLVLLGIVLVSGGGFLVIRLTGAFHSPLPVGLKKVEEGMQAVEWGGISVAVPEDYNVNDYYKKKNIMHGHFYPSSFGSVILTYDNEFLAHEAVQRLEIDEVRNRFIEIYEESSAKGKGYRMYMIRGTMMEEDEYEEQGTMEEVGMEPGKCFVSYYLLFKNPGLKNYLPAKYRDSYVEMYTAVFKSDINTPEVMDAEQTLAFDATKKAPGAKEEKNE